MRHLLNLKSLAVFGLMSAFFLLPLLASPGNSPQTHGLKGRVFFPKPKNRFVKKMESYEHRHGPNLKYAPNQGIVILKPLSFAPALRPTSNAVLTQKGMTFYPRVLPVTKGSTVYILNEDKEYHNVYSRTPGATFNIGRRPPGHMYPQKIKKSGLIRVFCDIHEQMNAYILSLDTPYFTRINKDNTYSLDKLPDGKYKLFVYHPDYPAHEEEIEIKGSKEITKDIRWQ